MTIKLLLYFLLLALCISGCIFDSGSDKISGDYEATWIDTPQRRGIQKGEEIVPPYVSQIGHNSKYIIAKQHPVTQENTITIQTETTNYFIIEISVNSFQDKPVYGPLSRQEFDSLRYKLDIEKIEFDQLYTENQQITNLLQVTHYSPLWHSKPKKSYPPSN